MKSGSKPVPRVRPEVTVAPVGNDEFVVKDRKTRAYFRVGPIESYLLKRLDGKAARQTVCDDFQKEFGEPLDLSDLDDFVGMIRSRNLLESTGGENASPTPQPDADDELNGQSWLFFRKPLFDPDKLLNRLEPWLRFLWTRWFVVCSFVCIVLASWTLWTERQDLVNGFRGTLRWETMLLVWCTLVFVTAIHEFAHGLTCKHYGGEVHEMGALMIFFMPCFYCDVTDSWLIPKKSHRMWVTLAGGYADLCVWSMTVFLWRITLTDSLLHYVTYVILTTLGTRVFLNLNPLLRLDGYYLISDWLEIPNLRTQSRDYFMAHVRWLCWGAQRPPPEPRGGWLLAFGCTTWLVALTTLHLIIFSVHKFVMGQFGWTGTVLSGIGLLFVSRRVSHGLLTSEFVTMLKQRHLRTAIWAGAVILVPAIVFWIPIDNTSIGALTVRPGQRIEVHAGVGGFLRDIRVDEGFEVTSKTLIGRIEVPDLESLIVRKQADIHECEATVAKLRAGPRKEEIAEQEARIARSVDWVELAKADLARSRVSLNHSLQQLDEAILQSSAELAFARQSYDRAFNLYRLGAFAGEQLRSEHKRVILLKSRMTQAESEKRARQVDGVRQSEAELARREKELADAQSALRLLKAGSRTEDITAETAKLTRLQEELRFLTDESAKQTLISPVSGIVSTPRMAEKSGTLLEKGAVVCIVDNINTVCVDIDVEEDSITGVAAGQNVELRVRALPFDTFQAKVDRIAPSASQAPNQSQSRVTVLCKVDNQDKKLKPGMTGSARINRGQKRLGMILVQRILREFRTEFWW